MSLWVGRVNLVPVEVAKGEVAPIVQAHQVAGRDSVDPAPRSDVDNQRVVQTGRAHSLGAARPAARQPQHRAARIAHDPPVESQRHGPRARLRRPRDERGRPDRPAIRATASPSSTSVTVAVTSTRLDASALSASA